jgi:hypothetical protein
MPHINTVLEDESSLNNLMDVDTTSTNPNQGDTLVWDGSNWVPSAVAGTVQSINDLNDVDTATSPPTNGQALVWNGSKWAPATPASSLDDLDDVDTSTTPPSDGQTLAWDNNTNLWKPHDLTTTVESLENVSSGTTHDNDILQYSQSYGEWRKQEHRLSLATNVDSNTNPGFPNNGDVLTYDSGTQTWRAAAPSGGGGSGSWVSKWTGYAFSQANIWGAGQYIIKNEDDKYLYVHVPVTGIDYKGPALVEIESFQPNQAQTWYRFVSYESDEFYTVYEYTDNDAANGTLTYAAMSDSSESRKAVTEIFRFE